MNRIESKARTSVLAVLLALMLALGFAGSAKAGGASTFAFTGAGTNTGSACWLNYTVTLAGFSGWYAVVGVDASSLALDVDYFFDGDGFGVYNGFMDLAGSGAINTIAAGPVTGSVYYHGISVPPAAHQASPDTAASFTYATSTGLLDSQSSINPTPIVGSCAFASPSSTLPADGRINPQPGATVAIYCTSDGGFDIYGIDRTTGQGFLAIRMTAEDVAGVPEHPAANLLVREFGDIRLYRLTTGEWQVNRGPDAEGKTYVYIWRNCASGGGHEASFSLNNPPPAPMTAVNEVFAAIGQAVRMAFTRVFAAE